MALTRWAKSRAVLQAHAIAAALAVTLLLGCGSDDDGGGGQPTPTDTPVEDTATPLPTATPVPGAPGAGVSSSIVGASVDPEGVLSVEFTLTDDDGVPIEPVRSATSNPNQGRVRFTVAHLEEYSGGGEFMASTFTRYVNDVNARRPAYDANGMIETIDGGAGLYRYIFNTRLPEGFDGSRTYSVGLQVDRTFQGTQLSANPVFDFVPAGGSPVVRAGSTTAECNKCHDPLILHGNRREYRLCTLCHTEASQDELGRSVDMRVMIHKIHLGVDLPSVSEGAPGSTYAIFSSFQRQDIVFAEKLEDGTVHGVAYPRPVLDCTSCHAGGPTSDSYLDKPSAAACAACHDDVNPSLVETDAGPPGTGHFQNRGFADGDCVFCHVPDSGQEFDISVHGAHVVPEQSSQLAGLNVEITGIENHAAGQNPVLSFKVTNDAGQALADLSGLNRLAFAFSGPTTDYLEPITVVAAGGGATGMLAGPDGQGVFRYTLANPLPADAGGTWAVGAEARRSVALSTVDGPPRMVNEAAPNVVVTFSTDGSSPLARREVVADDNCQRCHGEFSKGFSIHGNLRNRIEYCVICHNSTATDESRRRRDPEAVASGAATETIDFKVMIHKIHTGEELNQKPYLIYGFGPAPQNFTIHDFAEVLYPGDRRNCVACHIDGTYLLPPFPGTALPTLRTHLDPETGDEIVDGATAPITAACTSCHDSDAALAHAETQTTEDNREACSVCHMEGREVAVSNAHAR
jgi:OmcA/MtrC family decaheme c-type cytochrome